MATDRDITQLNAATSMASTDLFPIVADPLGSAETKKITKANMLTNIPANNLLITSQAIGDILYASSTAIWSRLGIGSSGQFLGISGGIPAWTGITNAAFGLTVVSSTSTVKGDYACDGTADDVQIQAAITATSSAGGGFVYLTAGTFNTAAPISGASNVTVVGLGMGATIVKQASGINDNVFSCIGKSNVYFKFLTIDGNKANNASGDNGINFDGCNNYGTSYIESKNNKLKGLAISSDAADSINGVFEDNVLHDNDQDGVACASGTIASGFLNKNIKIIRNFSYSNTQYGIGITVPADTYNGVVQPHIEQNLCYLNGTFGLQISGSKGARVLANMLDSNGYHGIDLGNFQVATQFKITDAIVADNICKNNSHVTGGYAGIKIEWAADCRITNNKCYDDQGGSATQAYGIDDGLHSTTGYNTIENNTCYGNIIAQCTGSAGFTVLSGNDTSPSVGRATKYFITNAGSTSVTTFDDAVAGNVYTFVATNSNTTLVDGSNLKIAGNYAMTADDCIRLLYDGTNFYELGRSTN